MTAEEVKGRGGTESRLGPPPGSWDRQVRKDRVEAMVHALVAGYAYVHLVNLNTPQSIISCAEGLVNEIDARYPDGTPMPTPRPIGNVEAIEDAAPPPPELKPGYNDHR